MDLRRLLPSAVVLAAACSDEIGLDQLKASIDVPAEVDFGDVPVGILKKRAIAVKNDGSGVLTVTAIRHGADFTSDAYVFGAPSRGLSVGAKSAVDIEASFQPLRADPAGFRTEITLESEVGTKTIVLKGRGVVAAISVEPNPLDFGRVLAGATRTLPVRVTNLLSDPITLSTEVDAGGAPVVRALFGDGRFVVAAPVTPRGSLVPNDGTLDPGTSIMLDVRYEPAAIASSNTDEGRWAIRTCDDPLCTVQVDLRGQATDSAIACEPAAVDFGAVNPGRNLVRPINCTNVAVDTITLTPWTLDPTSDPSFGLGVFPGPTEIPPGGTFTVPADFTPTEAQLRSGAHPMGLAIIGATGPGGTTIAPARVTLTGRAGGPTLQVAPEELHFGAIALGTARTKSLVVTNDGYEDLVISRVDADRAMTGAFSATPSVITLPVGTSTVIRVRFAPTAEGPVATTLSIESNDATSPVFFVPVDGAGIALPPCHYTVAPAQVNYGVVIAGETATTAVAITNTGTDPCLINDLEITSALMRPSHTLAAGRETGVMLPAGDTKLVNLRYTPTRTGPEEATLGFYISSPTAPEVAVPLFGVGQATTDITCPGNTTVVAGNPVVLTALGMTMGRTISGYSWRVVSGPNGGASTPDLWDPDPPRDASETFTPFIVGSYLIEATVHDSDGGTASCQFTVDVTGVGLQVTLTWNGPGDVDLHLHRPQSAQPWFDDSGGNIDDCYYSNRTPVWDAMSAPTDGANPELDFDNTSANGPENTRVEAPPLSVDYTIGVHNFSSAAGRVATVDIYCGGALLPIQTFVSRPLVGSDAGDCTANDFWKVATVTFTAPGTCIVTPIDTYVQSQDACMSF